MKSTRSTSSIRPVPPVQQHGVSVGVEEDSHVAGAGVSRADEFGPFRLELCLRLLDIRDADGKPADVPAELVALVLRIPEGERRLSERQLGRIVSVELETEHL